MTTELFKIVIHDDELLLRVPESTKPFWRKNYGRIGQLLSQIGLLVQRKQWPHFMISEDYSWTHIYPKGDVFEHVINNKHLCSCSPRVDVVNKIIIHMPLDPSIGDHVKNPESWESVIKTN